MNIYAIKDRMIDYYMQPFAGPDDKSVMAAISAQVNSGDMTGIAAAPHHYEIWRLATVDEKGEVCASKELLCDAHSLRREMQQPGQAAKQGEGGKRDS